MENENVLASWRSLNAALPALVESQVFDLLGYESLTKRRVTFMERLHQRYNALRVARERKELLGIAP